MLLGGQDKGKQSSGTVPQTTDEVKENTRFVKLPFRVFDKSDAILKAPC